MTQWRYKTVKLAAEGWFLGGNLNVTKFDKTLNDMGRQGWELIVAFDTNQGYGATRDVVAVFKRPA